MKKKKLIFIVRALWTGGVEISLINLLNSLDYERYDITCLITSNNLQLATQIDQRCKIVACDRADAQYPFKRLYGLGQKADNPSLLHRLFIWATPLIRSMENKLFAHYISHVLNDRCYDVAIIYDVYVAEIAVRGIKAKKYLMFYHHGAMRHAYHDLIGYKKSSAVIMVSDALCDGMKKQNPQFADKMMSIHNIVDIKKIKQGAAERIALSGSTIIVSCGRLSYEKGMDIAVLAAAAMRSRGVVDFKWYIVGGGREQQSLADMIKENHLDDVVFLVGEKANPFPYIKAADIFVQTSRQEAYGLSLVEALALERAVVATDTIGAREVLGNGLYGMLVAVNPEAVANAIEKMINTKGLLHSFQQKAKDAHFEKQNAVSLSRFYSLLES